MTCSEATINVHFLVFQSAQMTESRFLNKNFAKFGKSVSQAVYRGSLQGQKGGPGCRLILLNLDQRKVNKCLIQYQKQQFDKPCWKF